MVQPANLGSPARYFGTRRAIARFDSMLIKAALIRAQPSLKRESTSD